jgi:hypothetical protein
LKLAADASPSTNLEHVQTAVEVGTAFFAGAAPVVAGIGLAAMFINWLKDAYAATYVSASLLPRQLTFFLQA